MQLTIKELKGMIKEALIYGDKDPTKSFASSVPISAWGPDAVMKTWSTHRENRAYLFFLYKNGTMSEKQQAAKELEICDRKLAFWERHPAFDKAQAGVIAQKIMSNWAKKDVKKK
jgi:hypothetical protein